MAGEIRINAVSSIEDPQLRKRLWMIYHEAFQKVNERTPMHHGSYNEGQFDLILSDPDFVKYLTCVGEEVAGVCLITSVLEKVPWVNAAYFARRYPNLTRKGKVFFLPAVVIDPAYQDTRHIGARLLSEAITSLGEEGVLAIDYSETLRQGLPAFVGRRLRKSFQREVIERQVYEVFYYQKPN